VTSLRKSLKNVAIAFALVFVFPWAAMELLVRRIAGRDVWFLMHTEFISLIPGKTGVYIRNAYYFLALSKCPLDCGISFGSIISKNSTEVGHRVYIGWRTFIGLATIGDDSMISDSVQILSGKHQHGTTIPGVPFQSQPQSFTRVRIGKNTWIGANAVIMADVGDNCVIGAGSIVTNPVPENSVAVGNPAKIIRSTISAQTGLEAALPVAASEV